MKELLLISFLATPFVGVGVIILLEPSTPRRFVMIGLFAGLFAMGALI